MVLCLYITAQTTQKFTGKYNAERNTNGTATYYYIEKDFERKYEGDFSFTSDDDGYSSVVTIKGKYKNDQKNGIWIYTFSTKAKALLGQKIPATTEKVSGNYIMGNKEGEWIYIKIDNQTGKIVSKSTVHFYKNLLVGDFMFDKLTLKFDSSERIIESHQIFKDDKQIQFESKGIYTKDSIIFYMERNLNTGEILDKKEKIKKSDDFYINFSPDQINFWRPFKIYERQRNVFTWNNLILHGDNSKFLPHG